MDCIIEQSWGLVVAGGAPHQPKKRNCDYTGLDSQHFVYCRDFYLRDSTRVFVRIITIIVNMADSIRDNESSMHSLATSNAAESSLLSYSPTEDSTSRDTFCESAADSSDNVYKDLDWGKYPGFAKAPHTKRQCTSWTWQYGYKIQHIKTETLYWLCKPCITKKAHKVALYANTGGSHSQIRHLKDKHNLDSSGPIQKKRKINFPDAVSMNTTIEQALINQRISNLNPDQFKTALVRWMA